MKSWSAARAPLLLLVLGAAAPAQVLLADLGKRHLPRQALDTTAIALGDVDGDGDLDAVLGNRSGPTRLYRNIGQARFTAAAGAFADADRTTAVALGDVDGDGDLDLVVGNSYGQDRLYRNDGNGSFTDVSAQLPPDSRADVRGVVLVDVDGDRDLDLVRAVYGQRNELQMNDGNGRFTDASSRLPADQTYDFAVAAGDVDGDRDLDLVFARGRTDALFLNDGGGNFTDASSRLPAVVDWSPAVALGDADGDGDVDIAIGNQRTQTQLYLNDGKGNFTDASSRLPTDAPHSQAITWLDVDGDRDLDLLVGSDGQNLLYRNDGGSGFADVTGSALPVHEGRTLALGVGDVDGDRDPDVLDAQLGQSHLWLGDGRGAFVDGSASWLPYTIMSASSVAAGDLDGDGDLDLVIGSMTVGPADRLYLGDGRGGFTHATAGRLPPSSDRAVGVALGDLDGDRDLDLVIACAPDCGPWGCRGGQNKLFLNDGTAHFTDVTAAQMPADTDATHGLVFGDVDGDGDLDIAWATGGSKRLYLNDGKARFTDASGRLPGGGALGVALGDVDGDGDLDLVGGRSGQNALYLNDGKASFTDASSQLPRDGDRTHAVLLVDVDGDRDLDLVCGNYRSQQNRLYRNDGQGRFADLTATHMPVLADPTVALLAADLDEDGDPDLLVGNYGAPDGYLMNTGGGRFVDLTASHMPHSATYTSSIAAGDVDGDADPDIVLAAVETPMVLANLSRQLTTPWLAVQGQVYEIDLYARAGFARQSDVVVTAVGVAGARIPIPPYGTFGLDPALSIVLPPVVVPPATAWTRISLALPADPRFVGVPLFAQGMFVHAPVRAHLSAAVRDVVR